jgi:hypothetical protein
MHGERKEEHDGRERDLELHMGALAEAQARGLYPQDNHDKLTEFVELHGLLWDTEVDHIIDADRLATLVRDVSMVLEDLGMSPIPGIPWDLQSASDILGVVDVILECMKEAYDSSHSP